MMDGTEAHVAVETLSLPLSGSLNFPDLSNGKLEEYLSLIENGERVEAVPRMPIADGPTSALLSVQTYEGQFGFRALPKAEGPPQAFVLYSTSLGQVFIKMNNVLMMQFSMKEFPQKIDLFVRALLVYVSDDDRAHAVNRCLVHYVEDDPQSQAHHDVNVCMCHFYKHAGHVIRSNSSHSIYCYDAESRRHSVLHPLTRPQPGTQHVLVPYIFSCQSSCASGMNRRSVQIVFTLEDSHGLVLGRDVLPVKICSCPKRDKDRMEKEKDPAGRNPGASRPSKREADSSSLELSSKVKVEKTGPRPVSPNQPSERDENSNSRRELKQLKQELREEKHRIRTSAKKLEDMIRASAEEQIRSLDLIEDKLNKIEEAL